MKTRQASIVNHKAKQVKNIRNDLQFNVDMTPIDEYIYKYIKYSPVNPLVQIRSYEIEKLKDTFELETIYSSQYITQEQKDVLSHLLIRCQRKELIAIKLAEQKIFQFYNEKLINEKETKFILNVLKKFKLPDIPTPQISNLGRYPIDDSVYETTAEQIQKEKESRSTTQTPNGPEKTKYDNLVKNVSEKQKEKRFLQDTEEYDEDFISVLDDCKTWMLDHLEEKEPKEPNNQETIDAEKALDEDMQKILNVWKSAGTEVISERYAIPEQYPPFAIKKSIKDVVGIEVAELEKGPLERAEYGPGSNQEKIKYGAWYMSPKEWDKHYQKQKKKNELTPEKIKELDTRNYIRKRIHDIIGEPENDDDDDES